MLRTSNFKTQNVSPSRRLEQPIREGAEKRGNWKNPHRLELLVVDIEVFYFAARTDPHLRLDLLEADVEVFDFAAQTDPFPPRARVGGDFSSSSSSLESEGGARPPLR